MKFITSILLTVMIAVGAIAGSVHSLFVSTQTVDNYEQKSEQVTEQSQDFTHSLPFSVNQNIDLKLNKPNQPGYDFEGWYKDQDFTELFDENEPITEDTMLYAKMVKIDYTITLKYNAPSSITNPSFGNNTEEQVTLNFGNKISDVVKNPTSDNFTFQNWFYDNGHFLLQFDTNANFNLGDDFLSTLDGYQKDIGTRTFDVYGNWQVRKVKLSLYIEDISTTDPYLEIFVEYGTTLSQLKVILSKDFNLKLSDQFFADFDKTQQLNDQYQVVQDTDLLAHLKNETVVDKVVNTVKNNFWWIVAGEGVLFTLLIFALLKKRKKSDEKQ
ncbi:MAG: InlB B-repeat-containing protein [Clostridiales bacterium]|jgi:uncharacterized repeat protein (TIGR02543 family)|nr:InlB B-repeat-containing protein [Clostridiales bacterium]